MTNMLDLLREFDVDPYHLFGQEKFSVEFFEDPENLISYEAFGSLLERCVTATGCDHFGLLLGGRTGLSSLGRIGFAARNAPDVAAALRNVIDYFHTYDRGASGSLAIDGDVATIGHHVFWPVVQADRHIVDAGIATWCRIIRELCGPHWLPTKVSLRRSRPPGEPVHRMFFRCLVGFDAEQDSLSFPTGILDQAIRDAEPGLRKILLADLAPSRFAPGGALHDAVRRHVRLMLGSGTCSTGSVARALGINQRVLHRRLEQEGTSFRSVLDDVRYEVALQLLRHTDLPLSKIAAALDYTEASAFVRAFRRWSDSSPGSLRLAMARGASRNLGQVSPDV